MFFSKRTKRFCSFLLTAEEKEPKKTATPSPFKGDITDYGQRPPCVRVLVSLSSLCPSGVRDEFFIGWRSDNEANINNLRPCLNTEGYGGEEPPENRKCPNRFVRVGGKRWRMAEDEGRDDNRGRRSRTVGIAGER